MDDKSVSLDRRMYKKLNAFFKESKDPELHGLAPYVAEGHKVLMYMFEALEAAEQVKAPRGIKIEGLDFTVKQLNDEKAIGAIKMANWMLEVVKKQIGIEETNDENEIWVIERKEENEDWEFYTTAVTAAEANAYLSQVKSAIALFRKVRYVSTKSNEDEVEGKS